MRWHFASADVRAVMRRRVMEMLGLLAALVALGLAAALLSHDPADPSFNTATDRPASNLAGPMGAVISDLLLQTVGYASALPVLAWLAEEQAEETARLVPFTPWRMLTCDAAAEGITFATVIASARCLST